MLFGTFESSLGQVRWLDDVTRTTLKEIEQFTPTDRPSVIITTDGYVNQWFMNWRIGRYYLPKQDFWVLYEGEKRRVEHIRHDVLIEMRNSIPLRVPIFREGRVLWLVEPGSAFYRQLATVQKLRGGKYVFYSDITPDSPAFGIGEFEVFPTLFGFLPNLTSTGGQR